MAFNKKVFVRIFWVITIVLSAYYLYRGIKYRFYTDGNLEVKAAWYFAHLFTAIAPLLLGPFQFWTWLRVKHVNIHKLLGKIYIAGSLAGGLTALYLGLTIDLEGSIAPLVLLSTLWIFMTTAAWISIKRKNIKAHRLFMIRSYTLALVFVFLRLLGDIPEDVFFFYIQSPAIRDATLEWLSWIIPLLVVELIFSWIPLLRERKSRK